jgi:hypothetical protein
MMAMPQYATALALALLRIDVEQHRLRLWWFADPHRKAYTTQALLSPTIADYWAFNPAYAQVQNEHVWPIGWADIK